MNFLSTHKCGADYREFRSPAADLSSAPRVVLTPLHSLKTDLKRRAVSRLAGAAS
jgi:hypothetical protein